MLYKITAFKITRAKRIEVYTVEVEAPNPTMALERSCVKVKGPRICEIRESHGSDPGPEGAAKNVNL